MPDKIPIALKCFICILLMISPLMIYKYIIVQMWKLCVVLTNKFIDRFFDILLYIL